MCLRIVKAKSQVLQYSYQIQNYIFKLQRNTVFFDFLQKNANQSVKVVGARFTCRQRMAKHNLPSCHACPLPLFLRACQVALQVQGLLSHLSNLQQSWLLLIYISLLAIGGNYKNRFSKHKQVIFVWNKQNLNRYDTSTILLSTREITICNNKGNINKIYSFNKSVAYLQHLKINT